MRVRFNVKGYIDRRTPDLKNRYGHIIERRAWKRFRASLQYNTAAWIAGLSPMAYRGDKTEIQ